MFQPPPSFQRIITRPEAKAAGLLLYFTGLPCKHGHISERKTKNGNCQWCNSGCDHHQKIGTFPRNVAKLAGEPRYWTGEPCVNGHIAMRKTSNGCCMACYDGEDQRTKKTRARSPGHAAGPSTSRLAHKPTTPKTRSRSSPSRGLATMPIPRLLRPSSGRGGTPTKSNSTPKRRLDAMPAARGPGGEIRQAPRMGQAIPRQGA